MSDNTMTQVSEGFYEKDYVEDEFGIALKGFNLARLVFGIVCAFASLGALLCLILGHIFPDEIISNITGLGSAVVDGNYTGYMIAAWLQIAYSILGTAAVLMFIVKRNKLFAFIDLALFVVFFAASLVLGGFNLIADGAPCWFLYIILNPIWSFIALFAGKHFKYMPFK